MRAQEASTVASLPHPAANTVRYFNHGGQALEPIARQRYVIDTPREGPFFPSVPSLASFIDLDQCSATIISQPAIPGPVCRLPTQLFSCPLDQLDHSLRVGRHHTYFANASHRSHPAAQMFEK